MFQRGRKSWIGAVLAVALLLTASPGHAAARRGHGSAWPSLERLWEWALDWLGPGGPGLAAPPPAAREKSSSQIDPNGQPAPTGTTPTGTTQSDSAMGIDPNGGH